MKKEDGNKILCQYKKAFHEYEILETYEAGIVLYGTEIKSLRMGLSTFNDPYCDIKKGEVFLKGLHISKYENGSIFNHDPDRTKKLLLNKREILKIQNKIKDNGITIIPLKAYLTHGIAKIELAIARGKKLYDKREDLKKTDQKRYIEKSIKNN